MAEPSEVDASGTRTAEYAQRRERATAAAAEFRKAIESVLDPGSFVEFDLFAGVHTDDAKAQQPETETGVAGFGMVDGRHVAVYGFDARHFRGPVAEVIAQKLGKAQDLALTNGVPLVGWLDGEMADHGDVLTLDSWSRILANSARLSGVVPQLCVCAGEQVTGALGALLRLSDFRLTQDELPRLLSYLPPSAAEPPPFRPVSDPRNEFDDSLQEMLPVAGTDYDIRALLDSVFDRASLLKVGTPGAGTLVTAFGRLGGTVVAVVASDARVKGGLLDPASVAAGSRFIRFCDAFAVPIVVVVDSVGLEDDAGSIATLLYALTEATVPKLTLITGRALSGAYVALASPRRGADYTLCWPTADVGTVSDVSGSHHPALERALVDEVIEPGETRRALLRALELCINKVVQEPERRHGVAPS